MERDLESGKRLKLVLTEVSARLLEQAVGRFVVDVQARLPAGWTFGINTGGIVRVGLRSADGTLRPSLSGAEWAAVMAAIGSVVAERRGVEMPVLILEDRAWDEKTLASVMTALAPFSGQVIISTTRGPSAPVAGWSIVSVDLDQQGAADRIMRRLTETGYTEENFDRAQLQSLSSQ
jgi:xanthine/CO dehydrogenase XdhC/CoxF family maturation factor